MLRAAALLGCAVVPLRAFELKCFQGQGLIVDLDDGTWKDVQPAGGAEDGPVGSGEASTGDRAMTFPNDQWTQDWLNAFLSVHPELETKDQFGFPTGLYADLDEAGNPTGKAIAFDFAAGQPPDEARFAELIVSGTGIPASGVNVLSYRQSVTWRLRLPGVAADYASVVGSVRTSCTDSWELCDSSPCACELRQEDPGAHPLARLLPPGDGQTPDKFWDCSATQSCPSHVAPRLMAPTIVAEPDGSTNEEDIARYNAFLDVRPFPPPFFSRHEPFLLTARHVSAALLAAFL